MYIDYVFYMTLTLGSWVSFVSSISILSLYIANMIVLMKFICSHNFLKIGWINLKTPHVYMIHF